MSNDLAKAMADDRGSRGFWIVAGVVVLVWLVTRGVDDDSQPAPRRSPTSTTTSPTGIASTNRSTPFDQCLEVIRRTAGQLGVAPINIVETTDVRMVRFCTTDASVLVTCSKLDRKMVLTESPERPGC